MGPMDLQDDMEHGKGNDSHSNDGTRGGAANGSATRGSNNGAAGNGNHGNDGTNETVDAGATRGDTPQGAPDRSEMNVIASPSAERTTNHTADRTADRTVERTTTESTDRIAARPSDRPTEGSTAKSTARATDRTTVKSVSRSKALTSDETYVNGHLTPVAFTSIAILTFITFVGNFTQLQLSAALPTIVSEFGISVTTGQWLTSIFQLIMGVMVPLTAYLTRRFSTRQIVITSMVVFTIGSLLAWIGSSFLVVLLGRLLEAVGTGVMWPVLQITVFSIYPLSRRGMAMGTVGMAMSVAPAIGPTIGGWQTDANGWRSIFVTLTIIGVISLLLAVFGLHNFGEHDPDAHADFFSVGLSVVGFGGLMFGFTNIEAYPFTHPMVWGATLIGVIGIIWFVMRQVRGARAYEEARRGAKGAGDGTASSADGSSHAGTHTGTHTATTVSTAATGKRAPKPPLLDLGVLRNRSFTVGTICAALSFFAFSSIMVIMPLYIQDDRGYSATISGLVMMPGAFGMCISQFFGGKLLDRLGARPVAITGTAVLLFGTIMMSLIDRDTWIWWVSIWQFVRQIGMGFIIMPITTWSLNCLDHSEVSAGSAVTNTVRQIAGAIGAPVLVILMETLMQLHGGDKIDASIFGTQWTLRVSAFLVFIQMLIVIFGVKGEGAGSSHETAQKAVARFHEAHEARLASHMR